MTDPTTTDMAARIEGMRAEIAALNAATATPTGDPLAGRPTPALTSSADGPQGSVSPALSPGRDAHGYAPAFDPADVAAQMPPRPQSGTWHDPGEFREPAAPLAPPAWAEVPADLAAALAEYDAKRSTWDDAVDAVEEYRDKARQSRAQREATIRAAGRAAAQGKPRPKIPVEISEAEEETEVRVLSTVVDVRRSEADAAARKADSLTMTYAPQWAAEAVERFAPALAEATTTAQAAYEAAQRAEGVLNQAAHWRSLALAADLKRSGVRVNEHQRSRIMSDLLDAIKADRYQRAEAQRVAPTDLLNRTHEALGVLRVCSPGAIPHPDAVVIPGGVAEARTAWWAMHDAATPEAQQAYRSRHPRAYPPRP